MSGASTTLAGQHHADPPTKGTVARTGFRADVQGLRALAVVLVILYHARVPGISAGYVGVDVFFVISGFLITTHLVGEATATGRVRFAAFYARRVRRLLPAALVVVVATMAVSRAYLSPLRVSEVVTHAWFTTFYGLNYRLAAEGVDYQDASAAPSPLQHYWSLAVEEQFYLLWPLLVVVAVWTGRRWGRPVLPVAIAGVGAVSLAASVVLTGSDPSLSYFALHTRAWELMAGALVAAGAHRLSRLDRRVTTGAAWVGLAAIVAAAVVYDDSTAFPGSAALLPVSGAALVIAAGCSGQVPSITRLVRGRAVQTVGALSYGWYLWHWPVLLLYPLVVGRGGYRWQVNLAACLGALLLAYLTHRFVERPVQRSRWGTTAWLGAGAAVSAATAAVAALVLVSLPPLVGPGSAVARTDPNDLVQVQQAVASASVAGPAPRNLTPDVWRAVDDRPATATSPERCMADYPVEEQGACVYGDPRGRRTVVLLGDSHAEQWQPAFDRAGKEGGWRVISWTKASCPLPDRPVRQENLRTHVYVECSRWRSATLDRVVDLRPDLVVVSQSDQTAMADSTPQQYAEGSVATVDRLRDTGLRVTYLLDIPYPGSNVPDCLSTHLDDVSACASSGEATTAADRRDALRDALDSAGVPTVDPRAWLCSPTTCPPVVGDVMVYRDDTHVTATYSRWLAPAAATVLAGSGP